MFKKRLLPVFVAMAATGTLTAHGQSSENTVEEEIVITGVRAAELNAREAERNKQIFSSVISQDDAGDFADQNVAEALQRLPGITLQKSEGEGRFVSVRGLGPGFVTVQQNGSELASAGADDRSFALDSIPADLLGSIEVFKSLTPDMDLNSIGGAVNVKTVNAFDRKRDSLRVSVQGSYQDNAEKYSPKISIQGTNLLADDTFGIGYSLSWEKRELETYEVLHHETNDMRFVQQDHRNNTPDPTDVDSYMLIPFEFQNRQETAERTRQGASLDLRWRPVDSTELYFVSSYTEIEDLDLAWREYYRFGQAGADDIILTDRSSGLFGVVDADIQQQMFIQLGETSTTSFSVGGKHIIDMASGELTLDADYSWSDSKFAKPDGRRAQFRVRDVPLLGMSGKEFMTAQALSGAALVELAGLTTSDLPSGGQDSGFTTGIHLDTFDFDNLFIENSSRDDELSQFAFNVRKDFNEGFVSYIKAGISVKERERSRNQDRWSFNPAGESAGCNAYGEDEEMVLKCMTWASGNLSDFEMAYVNHPAFVYPAITYGAANELTKVTSVIATENIRQGLESVFRDYVLTEDSTAAYLMAEFRLADNQHLIAGARWDETEFSSTGYFAINNDNFQFSEADSMSFDYSIPIEGATTTYDKVYPSLHYRYEPREDILVRAALWTSFTRPSFDQARAHATLDSNFELCNPNTGLCSTTPAETGDNVQPDDLKDFTLSSNNTLKFGNPGLKAMTSNNFDASIGWYADDDLFLQAAVFYKDIDDFIVDINGVPLALNELPVRLPIDQVTAFTIPEDLVINNVNTTINGDKAKVYGIELSYSQNFSNGLFVQSNATLMNSEASVGETIRAGTIQLPDQADTTINFTFGWENDDISLRLINNYRSKILKRIGSCPAGSEGNILPVTAGTVTCKDWADIYHDATYSMDFKATYQITDELKLYFDALNLTDEYSIYYFQGNEYSGGKSLYHSEVYGRSFQFGLNYKFM